jgi:hypothetical protein
LEEEESVIEEEVGTEETNKGDEEELDVGVAEEELETIKSFVSITCVFLLILSFSSVSSLISLSFSDNEFSFIRRYLSFRLGNQSLSESSDCFFFFLSLLSFSECCCFLFSIIGILPETIGSILSVCSTKPSNVLFCEVADANNL